MEESVDHEQVVLFDLDGTLTPSRQEMPDIIVEALKRLSSFSRIGIVTGSPIQYLDEQTQFLQEDKSFAEEIEFFPCNGTQYYYFDYHEGLLVSSTLNMREYINPNRFQELMKILCSMQKKTVGRWPYLPLTGTFIEYRGSTVNWCPIGRSASTLDRKDFKEQNRNNIIRNILLEDLNAKIRYKGIEVVVVMGGDTSFDIYPRGWDKTYVLNHFTDDEDIWFVGDRCDGNGNDRALYEALPENRVFKTTGPKETIKIIDRKIIPCLKKLR